MEAYSQSDEEDELVAVIDMYNCAMPEAPVDEPSMAMLLQFPQRPFSRPYANVTKTRLKPKVRRLQWDVALDTSADNYNLPDHVDRASPFAIKSATLQSSRVDHGLQSLAMGFLHEGGLYFLAINEVMQLRHCPSHLDNLKEASTSKRAAAAAAAAAADDVAGPSRRDGPGTPPPPPDLQPLKVTVNKYETEQQVEARLRSYAYLSAQEEADKWIELEYRQSSGQRAQEVWQQLPPKPQALTAIPHYFSPEAILREIVPGVRQHEVEQPAEADGHHRQQQQQQQELELGRPPAQAPGKNALAPDAAAVLPTALEAMFRMSSVLSLENVRNLLLRRADSPALRRAATVASDTALHTAVIGAADVLHIRKVYLLRQLGDDGVDPIRDVIIALLAERESVRKGDVVAAAKVEGLEFVDGVYQRIMKELCTSRGSVWSLKQGS